MCKRVLLCAYIVPSQPVLESWVSMDWPIRGSVHTWLIGPMDQMSCMLDCSWIAKIDLFESCEQSFLEEVMLALRPRVYLTDDYVVVCQVDP